MPQVRLHVCLGSRTSHLSEPPSTRALESTRLGLLCWLWLLQSIFRCPGSTPSWLWVSVPATAVRDRETLVTGALQTLISAGCGPAHPTSWESPEEEEAGQECPGTELLQAGWCSDPQLQWRPSKGPPVY